MNNDLLTLPNDLTGMGAEDLFRIGLLFSRQIAEFF